MKQLEVNQTISGPNLSALLEGQNGTFVCQQGTRIYKVVSQEGHSITDGPTLIGQPLPETPLTTENKNWLVTKFSNSIEVEGSYQWQQQQGQRRSAEQRQ